MGDFAQQVGRKQPNAWGLRDMHGNVSEWCSDWFGEKLTGGADPVGASSGTLRACRGGYWFSLPPECRSASRDRDRPKRQASHIGFRVGMFRASQIDLQIADSQAEVNQPSPGQSRPGGLLPNTAEVIQTEVKPVGVTKGQVAQDQAAGNLPTGKWINVLSMVKLPEHAVLGKWERKGESVICFPMRNARIVIPVVIQGSYELQFEFTRTEGKECFAPIFTAGSHQCLMYIGGWGGAKHGLDVVKGVTIDQRDTPAVTRPGRLENGRRYHCRIEVEQADNTSHVQVELNKVKIVDWTGNDEDLSLRDDHVLPNRLCPGIMIFNSKMTIHSAQLRLSEDAIANRLGDDWKDR
jgi:hypothetical protein